MSVAFGTSLLGDGLEESHDGLAASVRRHIDLEVPGWIIQLRLDLIDLLQDSASHLVSEFIVRAESAIVGLQLIHGAKTKTRVELDRCLFLGFVAEALKPIVEWSDAQDSLCQTGYGELRAFYKLCQALPEEHNKQTWELQAEHEAADRARNVIWSEYRRKHVGSSGPYHELGDAIELGAVLRREVEIVLYKRPAVWRACGNLSYWQRFQLVSPRNVLAPLQKQYAWIEHPFPSWHATPVGRSVTVIERLARAFLAALEAECPAPEWMPRG